MRIRTRLFNFVRCRPGSGRRLRRARGPEAVGGQRADERLLVAGPFERSAKLSELRETVAEAQQVAGDTILSHIDSDIAAGRARYDALFKSALAQIDAFRNSQSPVEGSRIDVLRGRSGTLRRPARKAADLAMQNDATRASEINSASIQPIGGRLDLSMGSLRDEIVLLSGPEAAITTAGQLRADVPSRPSAAS